MQEPDAPFVHQDDEEAAFAASEAIDGFDAVRIGRDTEGRSALMCDAEGRILLLKRHGNRFAGRLLGQSAEARVEGETLIVSTGERRFGGARLHIDDAEAWVSAINALD